MEYFCLFDTFYRDAVMELVEDLGLGFIYYVTTRFKSLLSLKKLVFKLKKKFLISTIVLCFVFLPFKSSRTV